MPYQTTIFQLPCGARAFRLEISGVFSGEEAAAFSKLTDHGGELYGLPKIVNALEVTSVSPEARAVLAGRGELGDRETWSAVVVKDPVIKVTSNFISRVERTTKIKQFATEEEAIPWLDTRVREDLAAKAT